MNRIIIFFLAVVFNYGTYAQSRVSHEAFDELLQKYVNNDGLVDYKGLATERTKLKSYLQMIESNVPKSNWTKDQQLAYWINAYNAFTLDLVLEHYPIKSIKDIGSAIKIPFVNTPWDIKFINIGGEEYSLNNLEHGIIRKDFDEPRIHFVLACASVSCPKLQNRAILPEKMETQLTQASRQFLADKSKNEIFGSRAKLSKLFSWYRGDFTKKTSLIEFINKYSDTKLDKNARLDYQDYDWALNEQEKGSMK